MACVGVGVATVDTLQETNVTASAATTYETITHLTPLGSSGTTFIYAYPTNEAKPGVNSWDHAFSFVENSGDGVLWNGEAYSGWELKQPGDFYIGLGGKTATAGDILTIDGTFYNATVDANIVFENCGLRYNGSSWVSFTPVQYTTYTVTKVGATGSSTATVLYLYTISGDDLPKEKGDWDSVYTLEAGSGSGITLNGEVASVNSGDIKLPGDFFFTMNKAAVKDDVLAIDGTYYNESKAVKLVFEDCQLQFNGTSWVEYVPPIQYTTYELGKMSLTVNSQNANAKNSQLYLNQESGAALPYPDADWNTVFVYSSGDGLKVNGVSKDISEMKSTDLGLWLSFAAVKAGDIVTLSGAFVCDEKAAKYVIEESQFTWNGSVWESYTPPIQYTTYNVGKVAIDNGSDEKGVYLKRADGEAFAITDGTWAAKLTFETNSGAGAKLNDTTLTDIAIPETIYVGVGTAKSGDIFTIGGTFYNENLKVKYVIEESKFIWTGSAWGIYTPPVEYTTYTVTKVGATGDSDSTDLYLYTISGDELPKDKGDWNSVYTLETGSGAGVTLNGKAASINSGDIKLPGDFFFTMNKAAVKGDVLVIDGTYYNKDKAVKIVFDDCQLQFNGTAWISLYTDSELAAYDTISIFDLGLGSKQVISDTTDPETETVLYSYFGNNKNTTGSVKFRFGYNSTNTATGCIDIRIRGGAWEGYRFRILEGRVEYLESINVALSNNTDYVIELGAIDILDSDKVLIYIAINGAVMCDTTVGKNSAYTTSCVSIYAENIATTTLTDVDRVLITYCTDEFEYEDYAIIGQEYKIKAPKTYQYVIGWLDDYTDRFYKDGETIQVMEDMYLNAQCLDFKMDEGASIRVADSADTSGIRFTTKLLADDYNYLLGLDGVKSVSYGTLIMPYDYLGAGQAPNLEEFAVGERILKIPCEKKEEIGDYIVYRGAMQKLYTANYERLFAGRGYIEIIFMDGEVWTIYTPFEFDSNVRSIRSVAQDFKVDTSEPENGEIRYDTLSDTRKEIVDAYAASETINLMNYSKYKESTFLQSIAWYYPELDSSNRYNNKTNIAIAQKMKDAGITAVYLDGKYHLDLVTAENIEKTRQIINFFWSQGLYTIAFGSNASANVLIDYADIAFPDFSDCEGFMGYLVWDEPKKASFETLAGFAQNFEQVYAGTGVTFMTNLLPSYAAEFNTGSTGIFSSTIDKLKKADYKTYLKGYCDTVLSQVKGEKWLSLDSYPINKDKTLSPYFLFDLGMLKYHAETNDAHAHAVLQSSGWTEDGNTTKNRMPTEAEMRMQAYAAMAFGIDSISWWSYSNKRGDNQQNPTDSDEYYTRFANVNKELAAIGHIYKAFEWKGVILGAGKDNPTWNSATKTYVDNDYEAFNAVKSQIGAYELTASSTKHLAAVSTNKTDWNYLMGVMEDANGNEGYVLCNYNSHEENRAQTITLTFDSNITEVVIYRGGVKEDPKTVTNKTLAISLALGEGVIVLPSKLG